MLRLQEEELSEEDDDDQIGRWRHGRHQLIDESHVRRSLLVAVHRRRAALEVNGQQRLQRRHRRP